MKPNKLLTNLENFVAVPYWNKKIMRVRSLKSSQILRAHMPYFRRPGHILRWSHSLYMVDTWHSCVIDYDLCLAFWWTETDTDKYYSMCLVYQKCPVHAKAMHTYTSLIAIHVIVVAAQSCTWVQPLWIFFRYSSTLQQSNHLMSYHELCNQRFESRFFDFSRLQVKPLAWTSWKPICS